MNKHKKTNPLAALALSILIAAVLVVGAAAAPDPFKGNWYSVDIDGSNQTLLIGGGPGSSYHVRYYDDGASVCGWTPGASGLAASANGSLSASGFVLSGSMPVYCLTSPRTFWDNSAFAFTYNPATDTLTDLSFVTWHR
jgi:hypothetical protein